MDLTPRTVFVLLIILIVGAFLFERFYDWDAHFADVRLWSAGGG